MHKVAIILTKATSKKEALSNVKTFLDYYKDDVWDWYQIGGRWSGILAPNKAQYDEWAEAFIESKKSSREKEGGYVAQKTIDDNAEAFESKWREMGFRGPSPYSNHYNLPDSGGAYDIIKLNECLDTVKKWVGDRAKDIEEKWEKVVTERNKRIIEPSGYAMDGYYAKEYSNLVDGRFSWEFSVFNAETDSPDMPEETEVDKYFAVVVDMHN